MKILALLTLAVVWLTTASARGQEPARLVVEAQNAPARRWAELVRGDLRLVSDVVVVASSDLRLTAAAELDQGARALRVRLVSGESLLDEQLHPLGPLAGSADAALRAAAHRSADRALELLTGRAGGFDSTLVFARRAGRRRKDVWRVSVDGRDLARVSSGRSIAMLPALAHGDVWYSIVSRDGLFLTRAGLDETPLIGGDGLTMGVTPCGEGIAYSATPTGDAEIYQASLDGLRTSRLTYHAGIDVSPTCSARGELAFISNRTGRPQIHVLGADALHPDRPPQPETQNQTPTWCPDPERRLLAFTQLERGSSVWTLDLDTGESTRVSPPGRYKDPAFSPDCRLLAYVGEGGLWLSSLDGRRRRRILTGPAETVRWGRLPLDR
ncbi:MAG: hypothetical protein VYE22_35845 [Myxococcota bacterium]|nr:hypothetical protein [Myxococcota bacterium]